MAAGTPSFDVRIYEVEERRSKAQDGPSSFRVRWKVAGEKHWQTFKRDGLADSFRLNLIAAAKRGEAFEVERGLPVKVLAERDAAEAAKAKPTGPSWFSHSRAFVDMKWPGVGRRQRQSIAEALATVTPALLLATAQGRPDPALLREALYGWSYRTARRQTREPGQPPVENPPPDHLAEAVAWLEGNTLPLDRLEDAETARGALDLLARTLTGRQASANTVARKRAVFYGCLDYAVELGHLPANPLDRIKWSAPKQVSAVDRRTVVNHDQALALLAAVREIEPRLEAWFGCMYYAAMRPEECQEFREDCIEFPERVGDFGDLTLAAANPDGGAGWTDSGEREAQELKHRAVGETRHPPAHPLLLIMLRRHLGTFGTAPDGRLFRGAEGGPVPSSRYTDVWRRAREKALTPAQVASPLAKTPYSLRHACVSGWLNAGVEAPRVAEWAGHSVHVLLKVYARCIDGGEAAARAKVAEALRGGG
jgi:integrase